MSEDAPKSPVSLVSRFRASDYAYSYVHQPENGFIHLDKDEIFQHPWAHEADAQRRDDLAHLHRVAKMARLGDYRVFDEAGGPTIYIKTEEEFNRFKIVLNPAEAVHQEFLQLRPRTRIRDLVNITRELEETAHAAGFGQTIEFGYDAQQKSIMLFASSKPAYFDFAQYAADNPEKFDRFFEMEYDAPEREDEYVEEEDTPKITKSDLFIRGGATDETATAPTGKLSLVQSITEADYPYFFPYELEIPKTQKEVNDMCALLRSYAAVTGNKDYKLLEHGNEVRIYFRTQSDMDRFYIASIFDDEIEQEFLPVAPDFDLEKLQAIADAFQSITDNAGFGKNVAFEVDAPGSRIIARAFSKKAYFDLEDYVRDNREQFTPFFVHRYEEPELEAAYPTAEDSAAPNIVDDTQEDYVIVKPLPKTFALIDPASIGIIIGGKTESTGRTANEDRPALTITDTTNDKTYPFVNYCDIPDAMNPQSRLHERRILTEKLHLMGVRRYKMIEHEREFEIRFKTHFDHVHFGQLQERDLSDPIAVDFALIAEKSKHVSNVSRLKNCFKRARDAAGLGQDEMHIRMNPQTRSVVVRAASLAGYMAFWQNVPHSGRKMLAHDL